jgi:hypothetical protein
MFPRNLSDVESYVVDLKETVMSISAVSSATYAPPAQAVQSTNPPATPSAAVDKPNDGDGDDGGGAAPVSAAAMSSPSTQAALSSLKIGG